MERRALLEDIMHRMGATRLQDAEQALAAMLGALGRWLPPDAATKLRAELPASLRPHMRGRGDADGKLDVDALLDAVARSEGIREGYAREHVQAVASALWDQLDQEARAALERVGWAELVRPSVGDRLPPPPRIPIGHHLANGRSGSQHPISEARIDRAQRESVVRAKNPHGDRKLSSGSEREGEAVEWKPPLAR
ncbi:MAG: DUF2267 domain-containing protein [Myxococcales bacterium]|nr:DUF2267 domain-containing protein [Myxococcales bacterium]